MDSTERHDIVNIISPALTYTQNLLLGFYGDVNDEQRQALKKIEACIKELTHHLYVPPQSGRD